MRRACMLALVGIAAAIVPAPAQSQQPVLDGHPRWMTRWSPSIDRGVDRPPGMAGAAAIVYPMAPVGLAFTAGNPAALTRQLAAAANWLRVGTGGASGDYRDALQPGSVSETAASGVGWTPVGERSVLAGHVAIARRSLDAPVFSGLSSALTSPLVVVDTSGSGIDETHARIGGAFARSFGRLALGLSAGYDVVTRNTQASPVPRIGRIAAPGVSGGLAWSPSDRFALGAHVRWHRHNERLSMYAIANATQLYEFEGYRDALGQSFNSQFLRVVRADETAFGLGAAGGLGAGRWTLYGELLSTEETHRSDDNPDGPADEWLGDGLRLGAALRAPILDGRLLPGLFVEWTARDHDLTRGEAPGVVFVEEDSRIDIRAELRGGERTAFEWLIAIDAIGTDRAATDSLAGIATDLKSWSRSFTIAGRRETGNWAFALGGGYGQYMPAGSIPRPDAVGPGYAAYLGPRLGRIATDANAWSIDGALGYRWADRWWTLQLSRNSVSAYPADVALPTAPDGDRSVWRIELVVASGA